MDTNTIHTISQQVLENTAQDMTGKYVWMFLAGLVVLMFKSSVFFIYDIVDGKVVSGNKLVVQNERLAGLNIEKPLPNLDLSRFKKND